MSQTTGEFTVAGVWPMGITVGNWREGGYAAHSLIHSCMHLTRCDVVFLFLLFLTSCFGAAVYANDDVCVICEL